MDNNKVTFDRYKLGERLVFLLRIAFAWGVLAGVAASVTVAAGVHLIQQLIK